MREVLYQWLLNFRTSDKEVLHVLLINQCVVVITHNAVILILSLIVQPAVTN